MKKIYLIYILLLIQFISNSQTTNFTDTKGELQITNSGQVTYSLPIALPPSLKNVSPVINLSYNSGMRSGIAGQGWNLNGISSINRISTRNDIDGFRDGVDFDSYDKLSLDGQRLILKSGIYWEAGSTYETEYKSNSKIELQFYNGIIYFIVTNPDSSQTWYGNTGNGVSLNATSINSWYVVKYKDIHGNVINYNYNTYSYNGTSQIYISEILFSGNETQNLKQINSIVFNYRLTNSNRVERDFLKGQSLYAFKILDNIQVYTDTNQFRKYKITQVSDESGYERVSQIQEFNSLNEPSNPILFNYDTTPTSTSITEKNYSNNLSFENIQLSGDYDGDGRLDFIADNQVYTNLFNGNSGNSPIGLPFAIATSPYPSKALSVTTTTNNKLNQFQSIANSTALPNGLSFKVYNVNGNSVNLSYTKNVNLGAPTPIIGFSHEFDKTIEGDFDGNGISEVLIISSQTPGGPIDPWDICNFLGTCGLYDLYPKANMLDLDPNIQSPNDLINIGSAAADLPTLLYDKIYVADFNGDGKSDILSINNQSGFYKIISFIKMGTIFTYLSPEIIGVGTLPVLASDKPILLGDYNGDGKTDFMSPNGIDSSDWTIYYSNPKLQQGNNLFDAVTVQTVPYHPTQTGQTYQDWTTYYAIDINKDGKSDLVSVYKNYYKPMWTINDHDTSWRVKGFTNMIGKSTGEIFTQTYDSGLRESNSPELPTPITSNYRYQGSNTDLVILRNHSQKIEYYNFNKNFNRDNNIISVSESNGNLVQTIEYAPMVANDFSFGNIATDFYSSSNNANYPNLEIIKNNSSLLVKKLTATINGNSKYQDFRYRSLISNFNIGTIGFERTARSSWYVSNSDTKIWTVQQNDYIKRGANIKTWTTTNPNTLFDSTPSDLLSTKSNFFDVYTDMFGQYNVLLTSQTNKDELTNVIVENIFSYDGTVSSANYFGLQTKSISNTYLGTSLQGITTIDTDYVNNANGVGNNYFIGRPIKTSTTKTIYPNDPTKIDTRTFIEKNTFNTLDLIKTEKSGHNTSFNSEDYTYDNFGNLLTKTVSSQGNPSLTPRTMIDEYDSTKRFVIKKTDNQGFITNLEYNSNGQVTKSTSYLGVINYFLFDSWGKLIQKATSGSSATTLISTIDYLKLSDGGFKTTSTNVVGDNAANTIQYNVSGQVVKNTTKGFANNTTISNSIEYDVLGRKTRESEPYFSTPNKWKTYTYDYLHRPITVTASTTRLQTLTYNGLTTTSVDDGKVTTATIDAIGNKIQTTDFGGQINFKFYATGQLKESVFGSNIISVKIDGWGNKIEMNDPNMGIYKYKYDDFGQLEFETNPKGKTIYSYDNFGKLTDKTLIGDGADFITKYKYNSFSQIVAESTTSLNNIFIDGFDYSFDNLHRLNGTTEYNSKFKHNKSIAYDSFGRITQETNIIADLASGFENTTKSINNYNSYNGILDKLTDSNNLVVWQLNSTNEKMQVLNATLGNGVIVNNEYDLDFYITKQKHSKNNINVVDNTYSFNPIKGTLSNRQNGILATNEIFKYDNLDRLVYWTNPRTNLIETQNYDSSGRIEKNSVGKYNYSNPPTNGIFRKTSISLNNDGYNYYLNKPLQEVKYTMFKSPLFINENSVGQTEFQYNSHLSRNQMDYGYNSNQTYEKLKLYTDDGNSEILKTSSSIKIISYIGGDAYSAPLYIEKVKNLLDGKITQNVYYLHRDHLGSIIAITDKKGLSVERRWFDSWGNLSKFQKNVELPQSIYDSVDLMMLDRGYTSHEQLAEVRLIHMNGRLYDPVLHTFLMPDNFVQQTANTQCYNRYTYGLNNPLMYTDPSGEAIPLIAAVAIGAFIGGATYTITAATTDIPFTIGGLAQATFVGAASGLVTFGIGEAATSLFANVYSQAAFQAAGHGLFQGTMTAVNGGNFWNGALAGALSSIASSAFAWDGNGGVSGLGWASSVRSSGAGMIAFGTIAGGVGAKLSGGNFWEGAAIGLIVSGLNHGVHQILKKQYLRYKIEKTGRKPDDPAVIESSQLNDFGEEIFPKNMELNDNPSFVLKDQILGKDYNRTGQEDYGETPVYSDDNGKTFKPTGIINISRIALKSWLILASTMGHELNHYYHFRSGIYNGWLRKYDMDYADAKSEYMSQHWEYLSGGIPTISYMQEKWNFIKSYK